MRLLSFATLLCALATIAPASAQEWALLDRALEGAASTFAAAERSLGSASMGLATKTYADALRQQRFRPPESAGEVTVLFKQQDASDSRCARFAAYVIPAPADSTATIHLCPQFFESGTDALRQTTILHEMVHVVAGPNECRAMAYTAQLQMLATGNFQPVATYWQQSGCTGSAFRLPSSHR